jgi:hypothetical protein
LLTGPSGLMQPENSVQAMAMIKPRSEVDFENATVGDKLACGHVPGNTIGPSEKLKASGFTPRRVNFLMGEYLCSPFQ